MKAKTFETFELILLSVIAAGIILILILFLLEGHLPGSRGDLRYSSPSVQTGQPIPGYPPLPPIFLTRQPGIWPVDRPLGKQTALVGRTPEGSFGRAVATGDVNSDHFEDLIISAPLVSLQRRAEGEIYVIPGPLAFGQIITMTQATALTLHGKEDEQLGNYLDSGDLNGDSYDDIVVGGWTLGVTYVVLGSPTLTTAVPSEITPIAKAAVLTVLNSGSGFIVCNLNGDTYDDLFFRSSQQVWGILGRADLSLNQSVTLSLGRSTVEITMNLPYPSAWDPSTQTLGCGDVDGDGYQDLIIGAYGENLGPRADAGRVYVVRGSAQITHDQSITIQLPDDADAIVEGTDPGDKLGKTVAVANVNGDNRADLILGAPGGSGPENLASGAGEVYLWLGRELQKQTVNLMAEAEWIVYGDESSGIFAGIIAAGDLDGDNQTEVVFSCERCDPVGHPYFFGGSVYVINANQILGMQSVALLSSLKILPSVKAPSLASALRIIDLDGDGYKDLIVSASSGGTPHQRLPETVFVIDYASLLPKQNIFTFLIMGFLLFAVVVVMFFLARRFADRQRFLRQSSN